MDFPVTLVQPRRSPLPAGVRELDAPPAVLPVYELGRLDVEQGGLLVVPDTDQEALFAVRERIRAFLDAGGVVASCVRHYRPWLPGGHYEPTRRKLTEYRVAKAAPHPVFDPIDELELHEYRGVVGFLAQGHLVAPQGVEVLLRDPDGHAVAYVDRQSMRGTILATSGANLAALGAWRGAIFPGAFRRLVDWAAAEGGAPP